jgi:hydrogenase expression/formation protein HypC
MRIVSVDGATALCDGRGQRERVSLALVGDAEAGTWLLVFKGAAVRTMTAVQAAATSAALDALEGVLAGSTDVDAHFADLVDREPQLPAHLREGAK